MHQTTMICLFARVKKSHCSQNTKHRPRMLVDSHSPLAPARLPMIFILEGIVSLWVLFIKGDFFIDVLTTSIYFHVTNPIAACLFFPPKWGGRFTSSPLPFDFFPFTRSLPISSQERTRRTPKAKGQRKRRRKTNVKTACHLLPIAHHRKPSEQKILKWHPISINTHTHHLSLSFLFLSSLPAPLPIAFTFRGTQTTELNND
jgi:hypothetical protein